MTKIEFKIDGQVITKKDDKTVVEKSRNEYTAVFDFDDTWTDVENKQAYFTRYKDGLCVKADIDETGACKVPWEVIEMPMFYVSVAGGDLKTVTRASVFVEQTGYSEDAEKSGTVPEVIRTPQSLLFKDNTLSMLDRNGEAVGSGAELPQVTVDSELSADSENPVQNKAVSAALHDIEQAVNSDCANALKRTATIRGETTIEDIAPNSSLNISGAQPGQIIKIRGKNLLKAIPDRTRFNIEITDNGIVVSSSGRQTLLDTEELAALHLKPGAAVTTSADVIGENISGTTGQVAIPPAVSGISPITLRSPGGARTTKLPEDYDPKNYLGLCIYGVCTYKNLQIEYGTEATEYEQGFDDVHVTADADGNAEAENIAYPTAVIETDSACTVEYNRDANRVIEKLEQAILSLGGDI